MNQPLFVLEGGKELALKLSALPRAVFNRGIREAGRAAVKPVIEKARAAAPRESGFLRKSLGLKVKVYKRDGNIAFIVGPRSGFGKEYRGRKRDPVYYAHLVENGFRIVAPNSLRSHFSRRVKRMTKTKGTGKTLGQVPPAPFLGPALKNSTAEIVSIMKSRLGEFVDRQAKVKA